MNNRASVSLSVLCVIFLIAAIVGWIVACIALNRSSNNTSNSTPIISGASKSQNPMDDYSPVITPGNKKTKPDENVDYFYLGRALSQPISDELLAEKSLCPYRVILSATTSPIRLNTLRKVLSCIDPRSYDAIELNLPLKFGRTQQEYVITKDLSTFPRLSIFRQEKDAGPISKMLQTIERCRQPTIVISVDDDIAYDRDVVFKLLRVLRITDYEAVVGFRGFSPEDFQSSFKNDFKMHPPTQRKADQLVQKLKQQDIEATPVYVIEGFGSIAYFSPLVNTQRMRQISEISNQCYRSDDLTISRALEESGVPRLRLPRSRKSPSALSVGLQADALHNIQDHFRSYDKCIGQIRKMNK